MLEDEKEASYLDSGLVIDSKDGGPEDSVLELVGLIGGVGSVGGYMAGESLLLPRHFGQELGHLSGGLSTPCGQGPGFLVLVLLELSFVPGTGSSLPMGWGMSKSGCSGILHHHFTQECQGCSPAMACS